jgi:anion-transporting  ArsA/GET3 family ATPase
MAKADKEEAIAQMSRAIRGLDAAIGKLDRAAALALATEKRKIFKLITELEERLGMARAFLRHLQTADVVVEPPKATSFKKLEKALANLQAIEVKTNAVAKLLAVAAALGDAVVGTRAEVSGRAT